MVFLFAYSILRCIPSKSFRVISLVLSVVFPLTLILAKSKTANSNLRLFFACFFLLTVTRSMPVESPYVLFSQLLSISFFVFFPLKKKKKKKKKKRWFFYSKKKKKKKKKKK